MSLLGGLFGSGGSKQAPSSVWGPQAAYLQQLYGQALGLANQQGGYAQTASPMGPTTQPVPAGPTTQRLGGRPRYGAQLRPPGSGAATPPTAGAPSYPGGPSPIQQASQGLSSGLFNWLGQGSPYLQGQINAYGQNLGNFFNQQVLPGIAQSFGYYGTGGGARESVAQGLAGQGLLQQYQQGVTGLQSADYANNLANVGSLYNLGMAPYSAAWQPLQQLGNLLGGPTVLGGGGSSKGPGLGYSLANQAIGGWTQPFGLLG